MPWGSRCGEGSRAPAWHGATWPAGYTSRLGRGGGIHLSPNLDLIGGDTLELWEFIPAEPGQMAREYPARMPNTTEEAPKVHTQSIPKICLEVGL